MTFCVGDDEVLMAAHTSKINYLDPRYAIRVFTLDRILTISQNYCCVV